jgi:hypothetical protein
MNFERNSVTNLPLEHLPDVSISFQILVEICLENSVTKVPLKNNIPPPPRRLYFLVKISKKKQIRHFAAYFRR